MVFLISVFNMKDPKEYLDKLIRDIRILLNYNLSYKEIQDTLISKGYKSGDIFLCYHAAQIAEQ